MPNLSLPGNPRYQPKELQPIFGYDNLYQTVAEVEIATLKVLGEIKVISSSEMALLTHAVESVLLGITTSEVDDVERKITKHDIRAWVQIARQKVPAGLRRWIHIPLTSYEVIDTARSLQFLRAHRQVVVKLSNRLIRHLAERVREFASVPQIGRTHGQHALPITVGFWLATVLHRIVTNVRSANHASEALVGKISGAVGAYNAQVSVGIAKVCSQQSFESRILNRLGLGAARISTQILPPEPLADYLWSCLKLSASLAQFGRDARHLMRIEIGELREPFDPGQVGSSTMAHKRNPINFENIEGTWIKAKNEFGKVLDTMISDHQRDLVGSSVSRDFPTIVVDLVFQLNKLLQETNGEPFISRIRVDREACARNLALEGDSILAEPIYIILQMMGYAGDAHDLVNHRALTIAKTKQITLFAAVLMLLESDNWNKMYSEEFRKLPKPAEYVGNAEKKALEIASIAEAYLSSSSA